MYLSGELMGNLKEHLYIVVSSRVDSSIDHSGVSLVKVSLGNLAQYLKEKID